MSIFDRFLKRRVDDVKRRLSLYAIIAYMILILVLSVVSFYSVRVSVNSLFDIECETVEVNEPDKQYY